MRKIEEEHVEMMGQRLVEKNNENQMDKNKGMRLLLTKSDIRDDWLQKLIFKSKDLKTGSVRVVE